MVYLESIVIPEKSGDAKRGNSVRVCYNITMCGNTFISRGSRVIYPCLVSMWFEQHKLSLDEENTRHTREIGQPYPIECYIYIKTIK